MRRFASVLLFVLGGWVLMTEMIVAFLDMKMGAGGTVTMIIIFVLFSALFLLPGAWASPGRRWRELGLTILIACGVSIFAGVSLLAVLLDPATKRYMATMPDLAYAPIAGTINLIAFMALGWLLYRRREPDPSEVFR